VQEEPVLGVGGFPDATSVLQVPVPPTTEQVNVPAPFPVLVEHRALNPYALQEPPVLAFELHVLAVPVAAEQNAGTPVASAEHVEFVTPNVEHVAAGASPVEQLLMSSP
jgi:hypothetical protein